MINRVENIDRITFLNQFPDKFFDWIIDDPPYFSGPEKRGFYGNKISKTSVKRVDYSKTNTWIVPKADYFDLLIRKSKNQIVWGCNYYDYQFEPGRIIWDKCNGNSSFSDCEEAFCSKHESIRLFRYMWNGMMQGLSLTAGHIGQGNKSLNEKRIHPTQKPIALYKWLLSKYAKAGDVIGSCHVGSGSDRIATYDFGCDFYGCELDPVHFKNQDDRFKTHISQTKLFAPVQLNI